MSSTAAAELATLDATAQAELVRAGGLRGRAGRGGDRADRGAEPDAQRRGRRRCSTRARRRGGPADARAVRRRALPGQGPGRRDRGRAVHRGLALPARQRVHARPPSSSTRLRRAGLVILGKTNTPEFGMAPPASRCCYGPTRNPWDPTARRAVPAADRRPRSRPAWCRWPTATTSAARSATRPRRAGCSASSRPGPATRSGPSTATRSRGWAVEHALTRSVRDSAALLDATSGPDARRPVPGAAAGPAVRRRGRRRSRPAAHRLHRRTPDGELGHPDCVGRLDDAVGAVRRRSATSWSRPTCPA